jgi:hypothetical protein
MGGPSCKLRRNPDGDGRSGRTPRNVIGPSAGSVSRFGVHPFSPGKPISWHATPKRGWFLGAAHTPFTQGQGSPR